MIKDRKSILFERVISRYITPEETRELAKILEDDRVFVDLMGDGVMTIIRAGLAALGGYILESFDMTDKNDQVKDREKYVLIPPLSSMARREDFVLFFPSYDKARVEAEKLCRQTGGEYSIYRFAGKCSAGEPPIIWEEREICEIVRKKGVITPRISEEEIDGLLTEEDYE